MPRIATTAFAALLLAASLARAATPDDSIRYRKAVMNTMAGHFGAITLIFTGKVEFQDALLDHAEALAAAGAQAERLFPAGSGTGKTDALPLIWQEAEKFQKAATDMKSASAQLRDAIRGGDKAAIGKAMKPVADACKNCHDRYRKDEKKM
jgi:cytochrome c556